MSEKRAVAELQLEMGEPLLVLEGRHVRIRFVCLGDTVTVEVLRDDGAPIWRQTAPAQHFATEMRLSALSV